MITVQENTDGLFYIKGGLTHASCIALKDLIEKKLERYDTVVLDCSDLVSIDAGGIGVLTLLSMFVKSKDRVLHLKNLNGQPLHLIKFLELQSFFIGV